MLETSLFLEPSTGIAYAVEEARHCAIPNPNPNLNPGGGALLRHP